MNTADHGPPTTANHTPLPIPLPIPTCPHCNATNAAPNGGTPTNPQFRCRACGRFYYAHRRPNLTERPCPHCNGPCIKRGFQRNGAQKYKCKTCGKMNTDLYPHTPPLEWEKGTGAKILTLYLDVHAQWHLDRYCRATGRNYVQAIRHLLREVATPRFSGHTAAHPSPLSRLRERERGPGGEVGGQVAVTFPDARPQSRKQRIGLPRRQAHKYITLKITVLLDALCLQGIQRTRDHLRTTQPSTPNTTNQTPTHQDAIRHIIRNARLPDTPKPTTAPPPPAQTLTPDLFITTGIQQIRQ